MNEMVTTGNCPWWLIVKGEGVVTKLLIAERGTGVANEAEELEEDPEPEEPLPDALLDEFWLDEERAVVGVDEERLLELEVAAPRVVLFEETVVVFPPVLPVLLVKALTGDDELNPAFDEGLSVLTAPLELEDVRPDVLCEVEPELELLVPWM